MSKKILVELDDALADLLSQTVYEINEACSADWTPATLAASFLEHMLMDTECECGTTLH